MSSSALIHPDSHVVDVLANTKGRDQPIMPIRNAVTLASMINAETILDSNTVYLDPFCKAGEILLAVAMHSCRVKSKRQESLTTSDEIIRELYSGRYYGMSPDKRHLLLTKRTFYGNDRSHESLESEWLRNGAFLSETTGLANIEKFEEELKTMIEYIKSQVKNPKVIAIGNPPYQESDGGFNKSARNIYQLFADALIKSEDIDEIALVIPARWFGGGKGLQDFRKEMLRTPHLQNLKYFSKANEVFPSVDINGGVCFIHYNKAYSGETTFSDSKFTTQIKLDAFDIIPDDPKAFEIVEKVQKSWTNTYVGEVAWAGKPFGLRTFYFDKASNREKNLKSTVPCLSKGRKIYYVSQSKLKKNVDKIDLWKVSVPKAVGGSKGKRRSTVPKNQVILVEPGTITTETYNIIEVFKTKKEAMAFIAYLQTDFVRYLVGLRKITQDLPADRWNWVPRLDMKKIWSDSELYKMFKLSKEEQKHIRQKVEEWS